MCVCLFLGFTVAKVHPSRHRLWLETMWYKLWRWACSIRTKQYAYYSYGFFWFANFYSSL